MAIDQQHSAEKRERKRILARAWYHAHPGRQAARTRAYRLRQIQTKPWFWCLKGAAERAKRAGINFSLTEMWARGCFTGFCAVSGIPFAAVSGTHGPDFYSLTIDRIDSLLGYTPENCRFVLFAVNAMKGARPDHEMIALAKRIAKRAA